MTDLVRLDNGSYTHPDDTGEPTTLKPRVSITDDEGAILSGLAAGRNVFEIGTGLGVSTRALARWACRVVTHDIDPWVQHNIWPDLLLVAGVTPTRDDYVSPRNFDLVFIDGDHATEAVQRDITFAADIEPVLIVCHDAKYLNVRRAIESADFLDWLFLDTEHGLAIGR